MALFSSELQNANTKLFILDTGRIEHRDIDFEMYSWNKHRYNLVEPGDLFIYRKPQKVSENGKFYFFGAGKIESISCSSPPLRKFEFSSLLSVVETPLNALVCLLFFLVALPLRELRGRPRRDEKR
mgnify:CR=1 FL=1